MKKIATITSIFFLILVGLIAGSAFYLSHYVDPNKFKGRVSQYVFAKTGQVLVINGNMEWSVFPWVGLKANNLTYYNAPNFTPKTFVSAKEMDIKVKLSPLLTGKIEVGNITLSDVIVNLIKNKKGDYNWQTITKQTKVEPAIAKQNAHASLNQLSIESLKIKNGKVNWLDQQQNSKIYISALNVNSKDIRFGQPFPLALQFIILNKNEDDVAIDLTTDISLMNNFKQYTLNNIHLKSEYLGDQNKIKTKLEGNLTVNLLKQNLLANANFFVNGIKGQVELIGENLSDDAKLTGMISTDDFNLRELLQDMGKPINTNSSDAFKTVSLLSKIEVINGTIQLKHLHAKMDNTDIFGNVNFVPKTKSINFNLTANNIVLDNYLTKKETTQPIAVNKSLLSTKIKEKQKPSVNLNGTLKVSHITLDKLKLSNFSTVINSKNNIIRLAPQATFYKGKINGVVTIDKRNPAVTLIAMKQAITNMDIKELLHQFSNADKLNGNTTINADLFAAINANNTFLSALNGKIKFVLTNGSVKGVDVIYQLSRAHSFIKHLPPPSLSDSKQTQFSALTADATILNGTINTDNLLLNSDYLKVDGKGVTNLNNKEIHYRLNALAQPKLANENKEIGKEVTVYQVPIKISGKLNKPSVNLDYIELAKKFYTKEIQKPIADHLGKSINQVKDSLKEQVQNKLKDYSTTKLLGKLITPKHNNNDVNPTMTNESSPQLVE